MPSKFASFNPAGRKGRLKGCESEDSGRIVAHENVYFSNGNYERRSSNRLADKNAKCLVVFERS